MLSIHNKHGLFFKLLQVRSLPNQFMYQFAGNTFHNKKANRDVDKNGYPKGTVVEEPKPYFHQVNYNREQYRSYGVKIQRVLKEKEVRKEEIAADPMLLLPRRKRRIYDRPKHDLNITNYRAWRVFDRHFLKVNHTYNQEVCKISCSPALVRKTFGIGQTDRLNPDSFKEITYFYTFEDDNLDLFWVVDWKGTTSYWGENLHNYDYENQDHIAPEKRKQRYPSKEDFWKSEEPHNFRVNCTSYADYLKFKTWFQEQIRITEETGVTWDQKADKAFPKFETYDEYSKDYKLDREPSVFKYTRDFWKDAAPKKQEGKKQAQEAAKTTEVKTTDASTTEAKTTEELLPISPAKKLDEKLRIQNESN